MFFVRLCLDRTDAGDLRSTHREAHRAYLRSSLITLIEHGPVFDPEDDTRKLGSFMVIEATNLEEARRFHDEDPFTRAGLFGAAHVYRFDRQ